MEQYGVDRTTSVVRQMKRTNDGPHPGEHERWRLILSLMLSALLATGFLVLIVTARPRLERSVSQLASLLPVGYAFAAGMVATVNPCGSLMLPSYVLFHLGADEDEPKPVVDQVFRAVRVAMAATAGFAVIFGAVGLIISAGGRWLTGLFPYAGLLVGTGMVVLGMWLLASHRSLGIVAASRVSITRQPTLGNVFLFGAAYGISSLSCTLPIFLVVIGSALGSGVFLLSMAQFVGYALGMGAVLAVITVGTVLFREAIERWLRRLIPYVHRVSALLLLGAGAYLVYYWLVEVGLLG